MCKNLDESENNYAEWYELVKKRVQIVWFYVYVKY